MSQDIVQEAVFFLHSVFMGVIITFVYDWFLIIRKLIKHGAIWISLEDFVFWFACGLGVFNMLYRENNGILRWFTVIGAMLGMACYKWLVSKKFVQIMSTCIYKIMRILFRILQIIVKPVNLLLKMLGKITKFFRKKIKRCQNYIKNRLTVCIKVVKMVLCKH